MTQADRSQWQRAAAGTLRHVLGTFSILPALTWTVSRSGHLSGWAGDAIAPGDRRWALTAWQEALQFPDVRESPGTSRAPGRLHARGQWGPVSIGLAASVLPAGAGPRPPALVPEGGGSGFPVTHRQIRAADTLEDLLDQDAELEAITWQVLPSGFLAGRVSARGTGRDGRALFSSWAQALELDDVTTAPAGRGDLTRVDGCTSRGSVDIMLTAVMPARSQGPARKAPATRRSQQLDIIHEPPDPGRNRPGGILLPPYASPGSPAAAQRPSPRM
jgi:hypothetical protein